jgi:hypothetical protein
LWQKLLADPQETVLACEQLAIHYERHIRDFARAAEFAQLGLKSLQRQMADSRDPYTSARHGRLQEKFICRLARLRHRIRSADGADGAPLPVQAAAAAPGSSQRSR